MIRSIFYTAFFFLLWTTEIYGQQILSPQKINEKIVSYLMSPNTIRTTQLKDSVDFYAFAIELKVSRIGNKTSVNTINVNDSIAYVLYKDFNFLKEINFHSIIKERKEAVIIIPVGIIIAYVKKPISTIPLLKAEELMPKIVKMFNKKYDSDNTLSDFIYLDPMMCIGGTKVYD